MLFFELFPAFMALVALVAGIWLFLMDRQADRDSGDRDGPGSRQAEAG